MQQWVADNGLALHPTKTRLIDSQAESFTFLGYEFRGTTHVPRKQSVQKLKHALRVKTRRSSGKSLQCIVKSLNQTLRGWFGYFQHSTCTFVFDRIDGWLRGRLRSILRKRSGRRGRGRGADNQRWPNRFFANQGLFSLTAAHTLARQPSRR